MTREIDIAMNEMELGVCGQTIPKRPRGRPRGTGKGYTNKLEVRVTPEQEQEVQQQAAEAGLDVSKYVQAGAGGGAMTAHETYRNRRRAVASKLERLRHLLDEHAEAEDAHRTDWGYSGDLGYVEITLDTLVAFLEGEED